MQRYNLLKKKTDDIKKNLPILLLKIIFHLIVIFLRLTINNKIEKC